MSERCEQACGMQGRTRASSVMDADGPPGCEERGCMGSEEPPREDGVYMALEL